MCTAARRRHWGGGNGGSRQYLATASDWRDLSTYTQHHTELFPDLGAAGTEDQFVYMDSDGNYHAVRQPQPPPLPPALPHSRPHSRPAHTRSPRVTARYLRRAPHAAATTALAQQC